MDLSIHWVDALMPPSTAASSACRASGEGLCFQAVSCKAECVLQENMTRHEYCWYWSQGKRPRYADLHRVAYCALITLVFAASHSFHLKPCIQDFTELACETTLIETWCSSTPWVLSAPSPPTRFWLLGDIHQVCSSATGSQRLVAARRARL